MSVRRRRAALLLVTFLVSGGVVGAVLARRAHTPHGPVLVVRAAFPGAAPRAPPRAGNEDRAMAIAVASISAGNRRRLLELMNYTTARLEARLWPFGTDFGEGEPLEQFRRATAAYMPLFTAARELERGSWQSADLVVRVEPSCAQAFVAADETCISLWDTSDGPPDIGRRARFLAWAASRAAVVDLGTRERATTCANALRERIGFDSSTLALVLMDDDLALRPVPDRAALQEAARRLGRAMAANDVQDTQHLEAFARAAPQGLVAPWLVIPRTAIVVVPRLSALASPDALTREIESVAGGAPVRWLHHP